ncbi:uncharacterized protein LOC102313876 isoform X2 [Haplochromis burtoni]|nr:uncharacterized protein LOC102313876 isoform X2 [Haplochromis burtoni]
MGSHLDLVEGVVHSHAKHDVKLPIDSSYQSLSYDTPEAESTLMISSSTVFLKAANETLACSLNITYHPEPEFTSFTAIRTGNNVRITLKKKSDKLEMSKDELSVWGVQDTQEYGCILEAKETSKETDSFSCEIKGLPNTRFQKLKIKYGDKTVSLSNPPPHSVFPIVLSLLIPGILAVLLAIYLWRKSRSDRNGF